eukprot:m51a1_g5135 hypothetical protein (417) ;mRNA; r:2168-3691
MHTLPSAQIRGATLVLAVVEEAAGWFPRAAERFWSLVDPAVRDEHQRTGSAPRELLPIVSRARECEARKQGGVCLPLAIRTSPREDRSPERVAQAVGALLSPQWPVALRPVPGKGVGAFATRAVPRGETLLREAPFICASADSSLCYHCCARPAAASASCVPCRGGCGKAFCCQRCEREAWDRYHGPLCGRGLCDLEARHTARLGTARTKWSLLAWKALGVSLCSPRPRAPADCPPMCFLHRMGEPVVDASQAQPVYFDLRELLDEYEAFVRAAGMQFALDPNVTLEALSEVMRMCAANVFSMDDGGPSAPEALQMVGSMFNHECEPSAGYYYDQGEFVVVARRDIAQGDEVTVSYAYDDRYYERQRDLFLLHRFFCTCPKCASQSNAADDAALRAKFQSELAPDAQTLKNSNDDS